MVLRVVSYTSVIEADRQKWLTHLVTGLPGLDTKLDSLGLFSQPIWKKRTLTDCPLPYTQALTSILKHNKSTATSLNLPMIKKLSSKKTIKYSKANYTKLILEGKTLSFINISLLKKQVSIKVVKKIIYKIS